MQSLRLYLSHIRNVTAVEIAPSVSVDGIVICVGLLFIISITVGGWLYTKRQRARQRRVYLHDPFVMQLSRMGKAVKYRHLGESANVVVMQRPLKKSRVTVIHHAFRK
ncbi:hypothetical protein WA556_002836, partial [Blastocystis sp. ATCC 50177/Nand II]